MALLKFSEFKKQRAEIKAKKRKEIASQKYTEAFRSELAKFGVNSPIELNEDDYIKFIEALKSIKRTMGINESVNESGRFNLDPDAVFRVMDIAGQYTSEANPAADVEWSSVNDLVKYILDFIKDKKYRKAFLKDVKGYFPDLTIDESIDESHIDPGVKVVDKNGNTGFVQSWNDTENHYLVKMDADQKVLTFKDGEIEEVKNTKESVNESHIDSGTKVSDKEGNTGYVLSWSDAENKYDVKMDIDQKILKFGEDEITPIKVNESHINPGKKVVDKEGNTGYVLSWSDAENKYDVKMDIDQKILKFGEDEITVVTESHINPGTKVTDKEGNTGFVLSWSDDDNKYKVKMDSDQKVLEFGDDELIEINESKVNENFIDDIWKNADKNTVLYFAQKDEDGKYLVGTQTYKWYKTNSYWEPIENNLSKDAAIKIAKDKAAKDKFGQYIETADVMENVIIEGSQFKPGDKVKIEIEEDYYNYGTVIKCKGDTCHVKWDDGSETKNVKCSFLELKESKELDDKLVEKYNSLTANLSEDQRNFINTCFDKSISFDEIKKMAEAQNDANPNKKAILEFVNAINEEFDIEVVGTKGKEFHITINGQEYGYEPTSGSGLSVSDLERKFKGILKFSAGRALTWLKKNAVLAFGSQSKEVKNLKAKFMGEMFSYELNEKAIKIGDSQYKVKDITFNELKRFSNKFEGIVFLGAGGDIQEWVNGINDLLNKEGIGSGDIEDKFMGLFQLKTTGGRNDLVMIFNTKNPDKLNIGKLAMWRLRFGDASWVSDYVVNYANQHTLEESADVESIKSLIKGKSNKDVEPELVDFIANLFESGKTKEQVTKILGLSEQKISVSKKVKLPDGKTGQITAYDGARKVYIVMVDGETGTKEYPEEEIELNESSKNTNESPIAKLKYDQIGYAEILDNGDIVYYDEKNKKIRVSKSGNDPEENIQMFTSLGWQSIKESLIIEKDIKSKEDFKNYVYSVYKEAFKDSFDEKIADKVIDDLSKKYKEDWAAAAGAVKNSLGEANQTCGATGSAKIVEAEIKDEKQFKEYANEVLKKAHGDKFDQKIADKTIDDLLKKYKDDFGSMVGALTSGLGEMMKEGSEQTTDVIPGGKAEGKTVEDIAKKHEVSVDDINKELQVGIKVEREHVDTDEKAAEISRDHLFENPKYYTKLVQSGIVDEPDALKLAKEVLGVEPTKNESIKESSYTDFLTNYADEIKSAVKNAKAANKIYDKKIEAKGDKIDKKMKKYDTNVGNWVDSLIAGGEIDADTIAEFAIKNMNRFGTEPQFVLNAIEDFCEELSK